MLRKHIELRATCKRNWDHLKKRRKSHLQTLKWHWNCRYSEAHREDASNKEKLDFADWTAFKLGYKVLDHLRQWWEIIMVFNSHIWRHLPICSYRNVWRCNHEVKQNESFIKPIFHNKLSIVPPKRFDSYEQRLDEAEDRSDNALCSPRKSKSDDFRRNAWPGRPSWESEIRPAVQNKKLQETPSSNSHTIIRKISATALQS